MACRVIEHPGVEHGRQSSGKRTPKHQLDRSVYPVGETSTLMSDAGPGVREYIQSTIKKHERYYAGHSHCHRRSSPGVRAILPFLHMNEALSVEP